MDFMGDNRNHLAIFGGERSNTPVYLDSSLLRKALRANIVSFPSQIPVFLKYPPADVQWRVVLLFFVRGWSSSRIGARFKVQKHQIWRILKDWSIRALTLGYVQVIDQEAFALLCRGDIECRLNRQMASVFRELPPPDVPISVPSFSPPVLSLGVPVYAGENGVDSATWKEQVSHAIA